MKFKKTIILILAATMVLVAGCSSKGGSNEGNSVSNGTESSKSNTDAEKNSSSFKLWVGWSQTVNNDSLVQQYWRTEEPGVDVQIEATQGDALTALNLKLNTGGFEDAALFGRGNQIIGDAMRRSNLIMPLEQYFDMPDKYPNLAAIPKVYLDQMKDADGHIWSIPGYFDINPEDPFPDWSPHAWFIRTDLMEAAGLTKEDLTTLDGVEAYLESTAQMKDESGKSLLPLSMLIDNGDENVVLAAFGVTTGSAGGVTAVEKNGDQFTFKFDHPGFKEGFKWMNGLYRKGLIDPEVVTDKIERYREKNKSGRQAMNIGSFWNFDGNLYAQLDGPTSFGWYYEPIPFPKVEGVDKLGAVQVINPNPQFDTYISKNTKNLDAILKFYDYTLTPKPEWQHVINEGPIDKYWGWVDEEYGKWQFTDSDYKELRNSGDKSKIAQVTPQLYQTSTRSKEWYPWWNVVNDHVGAEKTTQFSQSISEFGAVKIAEKHDMVKAKAGGVWEKYAPELDTVYKEYRAQMIMAEDDAKFEVVWNEFMSALEKRAHWSELKQEWIETYQEMD